MRKFGLLGAWVRSLVVGPLGFVIFFVILFQLRCWFLRRRERRPRTGNWVALFALYMLCFSFPYGAYLVEFPLRRAAAKIVAEHPAEPMLNMPSNAAAAADVIMVMGGGVEPDGRLTSGSLARIEHGIRVWRRVPTAFFLFTEGQLSQDDGSIAFVKEYLVFRGIPRDRILLETEGGDTQSGIKNSAEMIGRRGFEQIVLVTGYRHLPRAYWTAKNYKLNPVVSVAPGKPDLTFCPSWGSYDYLAAVLNEYAGIAGYKLAGWL